MAYAKVFIDSTSYYNYANKTGSYLIKNVAPGTYTVSAYSRDRQFSAKVANITVKANDTTFLNIDLSFKAVQGAATTLVFTSVKKGGEAQVDNEIKNSDVSQSGIGQKEVAKVSNVTAAATKITGVSVVGGKYIYIRGLSDRYSKTILNQAEIPGLDPNRNSVQLDMFPTSFISSMVVIKTYSPEYPADWAGGMLDLRTKEFPESDSIQINLSIGATYNTMGNLKRNFLSYQGSKTDILGFDNGTRDLPAYMQNLINNNELDKMQKLPYAENQKVYTESIRSFNKVMQPITKLSGINHNLTFTIGDKTQWYKKGSDTTNISNRRTFGYFAGASYRRTFSHFDDGKLGKYKLTSSVNDVNTLVSNRTLDWEQSQDNVLVGSLVNFKYIANKRNSIGFNYIHNHNGQSSASIATGHTDEDAGITFRNQQLGYLARSMNSLQFYGEHKMINPDSVKARSRQKNYSGVIEAPVLDWTAAYTLAKQEEPDLRYITDDFNVNAGDTTFRFSSIYNAPARYFRSMEELNLDHKINLTIPIEIDSAKYIEIKTGFSNVTKFRNFTEHRFDLTTQGDYNGNMGDYLSDANTGYQDGEYKVGLLNLSSLKNSYSGFQNVAAGYLKLKVQLTPELDFMGGARDEMTIIRVESQDLKLPAGSLVRNDILPSINFNYSVWKDSLVRDKIDTTVNNKRDLKLRLGYNKTLARPNFRELAPYATEDYDLGYVLIGNSKLDRTLIDNFDLKLEYYPRRLEVFSIATFYKRFTNPIELLVNVEAANDEFQWRQVPRANLYGMEIEFKKRLDFISPMLDDWRFGGNLTLVKSAIQIQKQELDNIRATDVDHKSTRPLFGQSPYLINAYIEVEVDTAKFSDSFKKSPIGKFANGTSIALNYNVFGERLVLVVAGGTPDVYEMPFHTLNLVGSKKFNERLSITGKIENILNSTSRQIYKFKGKSDNYKKFTDEYTFNSFRLGINFSASLTYKF